MQTSTLKTFGWDSWLQGQTEDPCDKDTSVARVMAVDRNKLLLVGEQGQFRAKLSGKYRYESESTLELPCVGDWVCVDKTDAEDMGIVRKVLERKTYLRRKAPGEAVEYQMIAANVDVVIIVQSCHYDFNLNRLERYLAMIQDGGAKPFILLTKTDLVTPEELAEQIEQIKNAGITESLATISNKTKAGVAELKKILRPGMTYCFVGSSGVGKSTIINSFVGREMLETQGVSQTGEGRHTTVRRELILLDNGSMVIDNPGMREFGVFGTQSGIEESFSDILELAPDCRFRDCTHNKEPGCAVLKAVEQGDMDAEHHANFLKLQKESEHYQSSYLEKRQKDRTFGKFVKSAKKNSQKRR